MKENKPGKANDHPGSGPQEGAPRYRRINITIREDQYQMVNAHHLSLSALIRDLLDDRFSSHKVTLNLSEEAKKVYDVVVGSFGIPDSDLEPFFLKALDEFMQKRIEALSQLRSKLK